MCPLTHGLLSYWISFTPGQLFILPGPLVMRWMLRNVLSLATVPLHQHTVLICDFLCHLFSSFFLASSHFSKSFLLTIVFYLPLWHPFSLSNTNHFPSYSHSNRGCAAEPGGGPADQRLHGNSGPQCRPYLCYPGDAAPANHLEEERHHIELLGPGGYQCEYMLCFFIMVDAVVCCCW